MSYWLQILKKSGFLGTLILLSILITSMGLLSPIFIIHIFNRYISFGLEGTLFFLMLGAISVAIFEFFFRNLRNKIFSQIISKPIKITKLDFIINYFGRVGKKKNNVLESLDINNQFFQYLSPLNQSNIFDSLFVIIIIVFLFFLSKILCGIFVTILTIYLLIQNKIDKSKRFFIKVNKLKLHEKQIIRELSINSNYLEIFDSSKYLGFYYEKFLDKKLQNDVHLSSFDNYQFSSNHLLVLFSSIIIIGVGAMLVVNGDLSVGSLIGFNIFSSRALIMASSAQRSYLNLYGLNELIYSAYEKIRNSKDRVKGMQLNNIIGNIFLDKIDFSYDSKKDFLFRNFSLSIENSLINCIKGFNGAGKTTLSQILLGNLEPSSGEILVDGSNLNKLSLKWWKKNVAYIPQNSNIVNSSIYDNILFGNERLNEQEVSRLLQSVGLDKILKRSSLTILDNVDEEISKGILKKIHYARALAQNPKIFIIDDPLGYLDEEGRGMVLKLISSLKRAQKTIILFSDDERISKVSDKISILGN